MARRSGIPHPWRMRVRSWLAVGGSRVPIIPMGGIYQHRLGGRHVRPAVKDIQAAAVSGKDLTMPHFKEQACTACRNRSGGTGTIEFGSISSRASFTLLTRAVSRAQHRTYLTADAKRLRVDLVVKVREIRLDSSISCGPCTGAIDADTSPAVRIAVEAVQMPDAPYRKDILSPGLFRRICSDADGAFVCPVIGRSGCR